MIFFARRRFRRVRDDAGAMLIFALIIITTIAVVTGALLSHSMTNFNATVSLRSVAGTSYSADAAAKLAINNLRLGSSAPEWTVPGFNGSWNDGDWNGWVYTNYSDGTGCFGAQGTAARNQLVYPAVYPKSGDQTTDPAARVECTPVPGTGILSAGGGVVIDDPDETDPFGQALTTVGTTSNYCVDTSVTPTCSGIYFKVLGTGVGSTRLTAPIGGGITSRTRGMADLGDVVTEGPVYAVNGCASGTGTFISPDKQCNRGSVPDPTVPTSRLTSFPTNIVTTMPTPDGAGVCTFSEGAYLSGKALTDANAACPTSVFTSGKYYFDFLDGQTWTMSRRVFGGVVGSPATASVPGACQSPLKFPTTDGVLFVFGGSSNFDVANGAAVELCGKANLDGTPPLTIFQQQTGSTPTPATVGPVASGNVTTLATVANTRDAFTVVPPPVTPSPNDLTTALSAVGTTAAAWKATNKNNVGELDLQAFPGLAAIPSGNVITSAKLKVVYTSSLSAGATLTAGVTGQGGTVPLAASGADTDITALLNSQLAAGAFSATNPKIRLMVGGTTKVNDTASVDAVTLEVTHTAPALRPATSTVFLATKSNSTARFVVQGATYAPDGTINIDAGQSAFIAFRWGLLANGVGFKTYPQQVFGYPLVSIPKPGAGLGPTVTAVDLKVWVCTDGGACTAAGSGVHALTVRVLISDPPYSTHPVAGKRRMQVISWAEQN